MADRDDAWTARDLMLAMIALERGWIDGRRLREAFAAWKMSPDRAMAEVLASQGAVDSRGRVLLEALVDEHRSRDGDGRPREPAGPAPDKAQKDRPITVGSPSISLAV